MFKRIKKWFRDRKMSKKIDSIKLEHELAFTRRDNVTFEQCVALITHERKEVKAATGE